jgi:hypothetical protein
MIPQGAVRARSFRPRDSYSVLSVLPVLLFNPWPRVKPLVSYLATLNGARQALWSYLIWYLLVLVRYFDPSPRLWLTSLGLSAIIGVALVLSTAGTNATTKLDRWQIFRLFLMPFCVSSFAALVKDRGFILVFSLDWRDLVIGGVLILTFLAAVRLARSVARTENKTSIPQPAGERT